MKFMRGEVFRLEIDDPAYVFSIPKSVLEFDTDMPDNVRPMRRLTEVINANLIDYEKVYIYVFLPANDSVQ